MRGRPTFRRIAAAALAAAAGLVMSPVCTPGALAAPPAGRATPWQTVETAPQPGEVTQAVLQEIAVLPDDSVFAAGYTRHALPGVSEVRVLVERWNGTAWEQQATPDIESAPAADYMWGVSGTSARDVWVVGRSAGTPNPFAARPYALHFDGAAWASVPVPDPSGGAGATMLDVATGTQGDVWVVGVAYPLEAAGAVWHLAGGTWSAARLPVLRGCRGDNSTELTAVTVTPSGAVYAAGHCPTARGDAGFVAKMVGLARWQVVAQVPGPSDVTDLDAGADGRVWASGYQGTGAQTLALLLEGQPEGSGTSWTRHVPPAPADGGTEVASGVAVTARGVTLVGERDSTRGLRSPWVAGWNGSRWTGTTIAPVPADNAWLQAVDGGPTGQLWAAGAYLRPEDADLVAITARPAG